MGVRSRLTNGGFQGDQCVPRPARNGRTGSFASDAKPKKPLRSVIGEIRSVSWVIERTSRLAKPDLDRNRLLPAGSRQHPELRKCRSESGHCTVPLQSPAPKAGIHSPVELSLFRTGIRLNPDRPHRVQDRVVLYGVTKVDGAVAGNVPTEFRGEFDDKADREGACPSRASERVS